MLTVPCHLRSADLLRTRPPALGNQSLEGIRVEGQVERREPCDTVRSFIGEQPEQGMPRAVVGNGSPRPLVEQSGLEQTGQVPSALMSFGCAISILPSCAIHYTELRPFRGSVHRTGSGAKDSPSQAATRLTVRGVRLMQLPEVQASPGARGFWGRAGANRGQNANQSAEGKPASPGQQSPCDLRTRAGILQVWHFPRLISHAGSLFTCSLSIWAQRGCARAPRQARRSTVRPLASRKSRRNRRAVAGGRVPPGVKCRAASGVRPTRPPLLHRLSRHPQCGLVLYWQSLM